MGWWWRRNQDSGCDGKIKTWFLFDICHVKKEEDFNHIIMAVIFTFDPILPAEQGMPKRVVFLKIKKLNISELELTNG